MDTKENENDLRERGYVRTSEAIVVDDWLRFQWSKREKFSLEEIIVGIGSSILLWYSLSAISVKMNDLMWYYNAMRGVWND